ncbi:MAG: hypothetical protein LBU34_06715 [Planctomycetaceae bacterium]|nr:hypothetical protein [Planctomycetaceae bacterium]
MHITPLAGLRFRLPCGNKNLSANADATVRRTVAYLMNFWRKAFTYGRLPLELLIVKSASSADYFSPCIQYIQQLKLFPELKLFPVIHSR